MHVSGGGGRAGAWAAGVTTECPFSHLLIVSVALGPLKNQHLQIAPIFSSFTSDLLLLLLKTPFPQPRQ